jgi:hypothetical protein
MTGYLLAALGVLGGLGMIVIGDMVSEEVRDRLDHLPHAILRFAAKRLDPALRVTVYEDEWLPELTYILKGDEARPITRLIHGTRYAVSILANVGRITQHLNRAHSQIAAMQNNTLITAIEIIDPATGEARLTVGNRSHWTVHDVRVNVHVVSGPGKPPS